MRVMVPVTISFPGNHNCYRSGTQTLINEDRMKVPWFFLLIAALAAVILAAGCASQTGTPSAPPGDAPQAGTPMVTTSPEDLAAFALDLSDLPRGFEQIFEGEILPPDESTLLGDQDFVGSYSFAASNESEELAAGELVEQIVILYHKPASREHLDTLVKAFYPEFSSWSLSPLPDPGIGDVSSAYHFSDSGTTLSGYLVVFGEGEVYSILMTMRGDETADYALAREMAEKAAEKIRASGFPVK